MFLPFLTVQKLPHSKKKKKKYKMPKKKIWQQNDVVLNHNNDLTPYIFHKKSVEILKSTLFYFIEGLFSDNV